MSAGLKQYVSLLLACFHITCIAQQPQKALSRYINSRDTAYKWQTEDVVTTATGSFYEVSLRSQKWQEITWTHRLIVYFPKNGRHPNTVLLVLRHLYNRTAGLASLKVISDATGTAAAFLYDIPNQPLFDGKEEDDLQAYAFSQYLKSGEESWPLLFPMVKSVVRAMDAIQELAIKEDKQQVNRFVVAGHSKRGHASWLTAAVDSRVQGIIPIAIDVLNAKEQLPHHLKTFGTFHTPSEKATEFLNELNKPLGSSLIQMIDPYSYKEQLTLPKLIVCATNDEYFPTDALNLYWGGLKGAKSVLYVSNASHAGADSDPRINPTAFAFVRAVAGNKTLPHLSWELKRSNERVQLIITADTLATKAVLWQAAAQTKDFRKSQWMASPVRQTKKENTRQFVADVEKQSGVNGIFYIEVEFEEDGHKFLLSTQTFTY